jgi:hypothetical protein
MFTAVDEGVLITLLGQVAGSPAEHLVDALCSIIGLDKEVVLDNLTPKEWLDVVQATG